MRQVSGVEPVAQLFVQLEALKNEKRESVNRLGMKPGGIHFFRTLLQSKQL